MVSCKRRRGKVLARRCGQIRLSILDRGTVTNRMGMGSLHTLLAITTRDSGFMVKPQDMGNLSKGVEIHT